MGLGLGFMLFNATFNNISVISWWSVLLVDKQEYQEKTTDLPQVTDKLYTGVTWRKPLTCRKSLTNFIT
jgi:hypothetical protein